MAFINGNEILAALQVPIAQETGESTIKTMSQKAVTDALNEKQDTLTNTTAYDAVPVIGRNSSNVSYTTVSDGHGGNCVVRRNAKGNITLPPESAVPTDGDFAISASAVNTLLGGLVQATIYGTDVAKSGSLASAIKLTDYGMFVVKGEDVTVSFTANGSAMSIKSDFHIFIKYLSTSNVNKIIHLYLTSALQGYLKSFDGTLSTDLNVSNGSTEFGARVIKMRMKEVMS